MHLLRLSWYGSPTFLFCRLVFTIEKQTLHRYQAYRNDVRQTIVSSTKVLSVTLKFPFSTVHDNSCYVLGGKRHNSDLDRHSLLLWILHSLVNVKHYYKNLNFKQLMPLWVTQILSMKRTNCLHSNLINTIVIWSWSIDYVLINIFELNKLDINTQKI